jgi:hypothetical protein
MTIHPPTEKPEPGRCNNLLLYIAAVYDPDVALPIIGFYDERFGKFYANGPDSMMFPMNVVGWAYVPKFDKAKIGEA